MSRLILVLVLLLGFGFAKLPVEHGITQAQAAAGFSRINLDLNLRSQLGQSGFVAALGGFRSLVANLIWLEAHTAWEKTQWQKMKLLFDTVTTLQPRATMFWEMAAWHMAWNASVAARRDESIPLEALRIRAQQRYFELGRDFLQRGIENNPDKAILFERLGTLERDKFEDHCAAAEAFRQAAQRPDAMQYIPRFYAYELSKCPGKEQEAYAELMRLYNLGEDQHLPTLIVQIKAMEEALNIPATERIKDPQPEVGRGRASQPAPSPTSPTIPGTSTPLPTPGAGESQ